MKKLISIISRSGYKIFTFILFVLVILFYFVFSIASLNIYGILFPISILMLYVLIINHINEDIEQNNENRQKRRQIFYEVHLTKPKVKEFYFKLKKMRDYNTFRYYIDKKSMFINDYNQVLSEIKKIEKNNEQCTYKNKKYTFKEFIEVIEKNQSTIPKKIKKEFNLDLFEYYSLKYLSNSLIIEQKKNELINNLAAIFSFAITIISFINEIMNNWILVLGFMALFLLLTVITIFFFITAKKESCKEETGSYLNMYKLMNNQEDK